MTDELKVEQRKLDVELFLAQEFSSGDEKVVRQRLDEALTAGKDARIVVLSEMQHDIAVSSSERLKQHAAARNQFIVVPRGTGDLGGRIANRVAIYAPDGSEVLQEKISLSAGDVAKPPVPLAGDTILIHSAGHLRFAVLNCHDYTHVGLIRRLVDEELDIILVVSANTATEMFAEYAKADVHRLFCYVVICNVAEYGGSGVFAPFHRRKVAAYAAGEPAGTLSMGGVQYQSLGRARAQATVPLAIPELRALRERYRRIDPDNPKEVRKLPTIYEAIAPPENVTYSRPHYRRVLEGEHGVMDHAIVADPRPDDRRAGNQWSVAVAQVRSASLASYLRTGYMPSDDKEEADAVTARVEQVLSANADCDLLVFPEVFLPLRAPVGEGTLHDRVQDFASRTGTIVIAGVEYEVAAGEPEAANRVRIYAPDRPHVDYTKLTRSQYDARGNCEGAIGPPLPIRRGEHLVRFDVAGQLAVGVLTCFDYSHLEIVHAINLAGRAYNRPLDLLIVPCFNPYGALYADLARADAHRYYQYVVVCNVSMHGDSGVFGPLKIKARRRTLIQAGAGVDTVLRATLDVGGLRKHRDEMTDAQIAKEREDPSPDDPVPFHRKPGLFPR